MRKALTHKQEAEFDGYVQKWQKELGLMGWRIERGAWKTTALASLSADHGARLGSYVTGLWGGANVPTAHELEATACRELLHILLKDLMRAVREKADDVTLESAEHGIVNTLEKLLVPRPPAKAAARKPS